MASSSTSSIHKSHQFDVFLSFRGEDTRKNFVDHLYEALHLQGIRTFKDDERLEKGKRINDELLKSIDDSKFCIIVFSKNYASSSWCLDELVKIMESHKDTSYPVFYDVDPSEVRKQSGPVGEAFARHANEEDAGKWREALQKAANLSGWDVRKTCDGHEAKVKNLIVHQISLELRSINVDIDENLVGMEQRMQDLDTCLEIGDSDDVRMIGIKGMGGAGKTTLARTIFDRFSIHFKAKSFVENVREVSKSSGLRSLQKKVFSDVLKERDITVESVEGGKRMMKMRLCSKKILLVLDDVNHIEQLEALAGAPGWFKLGSRIIITTRDEQVLVAHKVKLIHDVTLLSDEEALRLFGRHAFGRDIPILEYETQSLEAIRYAAGLPLTIKVLGSSLCGKNKLEWTDALKRLRTIPLTETLEKLELSYESLENDYKEIFLDVTCFMRGWDKEYAIGALEKCGFHGRICLSVLKQRSLINFTSHKSGYYIDMHDHIEELGKNIVRRVHPDEPHEHSRLWIQEEIKDVLANNMGTEATRCVHLELTPEIALEGLGKLNKLRCLQVKKLTYKNFDDYVTIDEVSQCFPNSLRHLCWYDYPHWCLPKTFRASNLIALDMPWSKIKQLWPHGDRKVMKKLKYLDLNHSKLRKLDLGLTPNLERLNLSWCMDLEELSSSIGNLHKLVSLTLSYCKELKSLPQSLCSLQHLQTLDLKSCGIEEFPEDVGLLISLVELDVSSCKLRYIPNSIGMLKQLKILKLQCCKLLEFLPNELGHLECLEELYVDYTDVKHLPESICMLNYLKILSLHGCSALDHLPDDVGQLESLKVLILSRSNITNIPRSIGMLKHLRVLDLHGCTLLEKLPEELGDLESLVYYYI